MSRLDVEHQASLSICITHSLSPLSSTFSSINGEEPKPLFSSNLCSVLKSLIISFLFDSLTLPKHFKTSYLCFSLSLSLPLPHSLPLLTSGQPQKLRQEKMAVLSKSTTEQYCKPTTFSTAIPLVDLSKPDAKTLIVKACEEVGFFKIINHGVPMDSISLLESEAINFFSMPLSQKEKAGPPNPFGYGNKKIGPNGDVGWVEYLLLTSNQDYNSLRLSLAFGKNPEKFRCVVSDYMSAVKKMACEILDLVTEGLNIQQKNVFSKLLMDKESDCMLRLNHYPPCHDMGLNNKKGEKVIGFGEHTDPQIISLLRSNNTSGFEICLRDGSWISVPPDQNSFFVNVGDSLQVMTNGLFRSVKHRVLANGFKSRLSMIYFGGPPLSEKIAPLPSLIIGKESLYREYTWFEYKKSAYASRLADNRLGHFERIAATLR